MTDLNTGANRLAQLEEQVAQDRLARNGWLVAMVLAATMALVISVVGIALGLRAIDESDGSVAAGGGAETVTVDVSMGEFFFQPSSIEVPAGAELLVNLTNDGAVPTTSRSTERRAPSSWIPGRPRP